MLTKLLKREFLFPLVMTFTLLIKGIFNFFFFSDKGKTLHLRRHACYTGHYSSQSCYLGYAVYFCPMIDTGRAFEARGNGTQKDRQRLKDTRIEGRQW